MSWLDYRRGGAKGDRFVSSSSQQHFKNVFVYLLIYLFLCVSVCLSACLPLFTYLLTYWYVCLCVYVHSFIPSIHPSIHPFLSFFSETTCSSPFQIITAECNALCHTLIFLRLYFLFVYLFFLFLFCAYHYEIVSPRASWLDVCKG